ncbi:MAG: molybdopterin-binding protein [Ignavibacteriaceae bacterium]|nr:molybdopterin-binding protein [Ignavibacteriaceae bacterium]
MKAYIITIGDEILLGSTLNTNAAFIGTQLFDINIPVVKTSVIGDDNLSILNEIKSASEVADLILITGGLGPTHDDVTRKSIVDFLKQNLLTTMKCWKILKHSLIKEKESYLRLILIRRKFQSLQMLLEIVTEQHRENGLSRMEKYML